MTETLEAPTLTLGPETTRMLAALAYTAGQALHRRPARAAGEDRGRAGELRPDLTDPPVRTLFDGEAAGFDHSQAERQHTRGPGGTVSVAVGPLPDSGWALIAQAETDGGDLVAAVRCADEHTARAAAEEVLARGQNGVSRLHQVGELAAARAAAAARGEIEPDEQLWARAARALHEAWPGHARVVEQVVHGQSGQHGELGVDPTSAVLAARLEQLEGRGYPMVDVLRAVDPDRVGRELGRRTAAGAIDDQITRSLTGLAVVNLGGPIRPAGQTTQPARPARAAGVDDADIAPLLAAALPAETVAKVRGARGYAALVEDLRGRVGRGEDVAALLSGLPARNIDRAHDPAAYLKACVRRAAERIVVDGTIVEAAVTPAADPGQRADPRSGIEEAQHAAAAAVSDARADGHERDAADARDVPHDPTTPQREDLRGAAEARVDDALGPAERATAGAEHAAAAAARASLTPRADAAPQKAPRAPAGVGPAPRRYGGLQAAPGREAERRRRR